MCSADKLEHLREQFRKIDKDQTGLISADELWEALKLMNMNVEADEIHEIMTQIDYQGNGKINYSEFLAATISVRSVLTEKILWTLFKHFDTDDSNTITQENIKEAFAKAGKQVSEEEMDEILKNHDIVNDGQISFDEFKVMFLGVEIVTDTARSKN